MGGIVEPDSSLRAYRITRMAQVGGFECTVPAAPSTNERLSVSPGCVRASRKTERSRGPVVSARLFLSKKVFGFQVFRFQVSDAGRE